MPLKISHVHSGSLAERKMILPDEKIITINDQEIHDFLDLDYFGADDELKIELLSETGILRTVFIHKDDNTPLGIEPAVHHCRNCANNCIFCFIDQMTPDIRKSLYVKDDDYCLSFVYGNFITLTNLTGRDFNRIVLQRLSPLYISVHTTNPALHKKMMRYKHDFNILDGLRKLDTGRIELHTQIVIVPGWNDGSELNRSLKDLTESFCNILSIGIVPVGLTKFREDLTKIEKVNFRQAEEIIQLAKNFPRTYCSDEIFLLAAQAIPEQEYYDDYPQLENGIGMIRLLLENWKRVRKSFIKFLSKYSENFVFITAELAGGTIKKISNEINEYLPRKTRLQIITNNFLGDSITVAGLLSAADIMEQTRIRKNEIAVLPTNLLNRDDLTIDNISLSQIKKYFGGKLLLIAEEFEDWHLIE